MTTLAARVPAAFARLSRRRDGRLVAGVCAGLARTTRVDPTLVRLVFALLALAGGAGVVAYVGAWLALPEDAGEAVTRRRRFAGRAEGATLRGALEDALADVEEMHGIRVEIVQTGDTPLDERLQALVLAAREAVTNAAVHSGTGDVSVFVQVADADASVYVRDRGKGFDPTAPTDRRGIRESIERRLARNGGGAVVRSAPAEGTEVELRMPLQESS